VHHVPPAQLDAAEAMAQGRMKKKVLAAREALAGGVPQVILGDSRRPQPILAALAGEGTCFGEACEEAAAVPVLWPQFIPAPLLARGD
jgi:acetylglutamate/LysW-gamma-L-alpha-aminoadipate kinase